MRVSQHEGAGDACRKLRTKRGGASSGLGRRVGTFKHFGSEFRDCNSNVSFQGDNS